MRRILPAFLLAWIATAPMAATVQYQYDAEQRLTRATCAGGRIDYTCDATGNVLSATATGIATTAGVKVRVTPAAASWAFTDSAGALHSGTGNQDVANIPLGRIDIFWKPVAGMDPPQTNPGCGVLASAGGLTMTGIYTAAQTATINWTSYQ
ncbi:hypothetical protein LLG95_02450 [bacterium]|nr:hypothetical protein [bacterium]